MVLSNNTSLVYDANLVLNFVPEMTDFLIAASFFLIALTVDAQEVGAILMVSSLMHEQRNYLKLLDHHYDISNFPYIEALSNLDEVFFDNHIYKVYAENLLLCEASDLKEALLCLIASYFIFNIKYPDTSFRTFVVFEKLFLEASDTDENEIDISVTQIIRSIQLKQQARAR
ncbi:hypothetical protein TNCV_4676951 [Trichonephila clavipes]|nr:hypothetical protein TNCV_4676951 [Trichonephila clavipes]